MSECRSVRKWSSHHSRHPIQSSSFDGFAKFPLLVEEIVSEDSFLVVLQKLQIYFLPCFLPMPCSRPTTDTFS